MRASFLLAALALACADAPPSEVAQPDPPKAASPAGDDIVRRDGRVKGPSRPNVVLVTIDTLRADALPFYGNRESFTPALRQIASQSVRFSRAFTVTPLTIPAHSSLFTGKWPPQHGVQDNGDMVLSEDAVTMAEVLARAGFATMGSIGAEVTSHHWGFAQGFEAYFDDLGAEAANKANRWRVERPASEVVDDALMWLDKRNERDPRPFFAWLHVYDCHDPYRPPDEYGKLHPNRPYLGELEYVDFQLGRLFADLDAKGHLEDTWIVVMSDHGESLGAHGEAKHGMFLYNETTRIPLIIRPPGGTAERVAHFPVSTIDILPTVLGATDVRRAVPLDGIDLTPWLLGLRDQPPPPRAVYSESLYAYRHYGWAPQKAYITSEYKLMTGGSTELYARDDVFEETDLAPSRPDLAATLNTNLTEFTSGMVLDESMSDDASLSADRIAQLVALGYLAPDAAPHAAPTEDLPDPRDRLPMLAKAEGARAALRAGDLDAAREALTEVLATEPGLEEQRLMLIQVMTMQGDLDAAAAEAERAVKERPGSRTLNAEAMVRMARGEPETAMLAWQEALAYDRYNGTLWTEYLRALLTSGQLPELAAAAAEARALIPTLASLDVVDGHLALAAGDAEAAEEPLRRAVAHMPPLPMARLALAAVHRARGEPDRAEELLLEEVSWFPQSAAARMALVEIYAEQKRYAEQRDQLQAVVDATPADVVSRHALAMALFNLGDYAASHAEIQRCLDIDAQDARCRMLEANTLKKLGRDAEAKAAYEAALKLAKPTDGP